MALLQAGAGQPPGLLGGFNRGMGLLGNVLQTVAHTVSPMHKRRAEQEQAEMERQRALIEIARAQEGRQQQLYDQLMKQQESERRADNMFRSVVKDPGAYEDGALERLLMTKGDKLQGNPAAAGMLKQLLAPAPVPEQYTLTPGSARYDAKGNKIVEQPSLPREGRAPPAGYAWSAGGGLKPIPGGPADKPPAPLISPAQRAVDNTFAKDYVTFINGGAADAAKSIEELREAATTLESGRKNVTGPLLGAMPTWARATVNPVSADTQEAVEQTVQRSLRAILGAQFTEKEGERLIARAYNPRLEEATNAKRVRRLLTQLERALEAKQSAASYYEQNGTLAGFQGQYNFSVNDFNPDTEESSSNNDPLGIRRK